MSYENPIDTRIVQVVLDDLEDTNNHTVCELLAAAYGLPWSVPAEVAENARQAALQVISEHRTAERERDALANRRDYLEAHNV